MRQTFCLNIALRLDDEICNYGQHCVVIMVTIVFHIVLYKMVSSILSHLDFKTALWCRLLVSYLQIRKPEVQGSLKFLLHGAGTCPDLTLSDFPFSVYLQVPRPPCLKQDSSKQTIVYFVNEFLISKYRFFSPK